MTLSLLLILSIVILLLFPLLYKVKNNLFLFIGIVTSLIITILINYLFKSNINNLSGFLAKQFGFLFKDGSISNHQVYVFKLIVLCLMFIICLILIEILLRSFIKNNVYKNEERKSLIYLISSFVLKLINSSFIIVFLIVSLTIMNTFWGLNNGILNRIFHFVRDWILNL